MREQILGGEWSGMRGVGVGCEDECRPSCTIRTLAWRRPWIRLSWLLGWKSPNDLSRSLVPSRGKVAMSTMPAELGEVFRGFFQEYSIIRVKWRLYKQLFGNTECIDLLNRHGAHGFAVVQDVLIKDLILCITRMMNT